MSSMLEVYYKSPRSESRDAKIIKGLIPFGAHLTYREESDFTVSLTFEFAERLLAQKASDYLREMGEHVEGVQDY